MDDATAPVSKHMDWFCVWMFTRWDVGRLGQNSLGFCINQYVHWLAPMQRPKFALHRLEHIRMKSEVNPGEFPGELSN